MNNDSNNRELILKGVHLDLTESLKTIVHEKVTRLFRHEERIVRIRIELEHDKTKGREKEFIAKGHIEIQGPDMNVSVCSGDCLKSLDEMIDKLDRMLRRRSRLKKVKRNHPHAVDIPAALPKVV